MNGTMLTVRQVCENYGLSERTVRRYIADGRFTVYRVGPRLIRLRADDVSRAIGGEAQQSSERVALCAVINACLDELSVDELKRFAQAAEITLDNQRKAHA